MTSIVRSRINGTNFSDQDEADQTLTQFKNTGLSSSLVITALTANVKCLIV